MISNVTIFIHTFVVGIKTKCVCFEQLKNLRLTMKVTVFYIVVLHNLILTKEASLTPLKPENSSALVGNGFTTKYFKSLTFDTKYNKDFIPWCLEFITQRKHLPQNMTG